MKKIYILLITLFIILTFFIGFIFGQIKGKNDVINGQKVLNNQTTLIEYDNNIYRYN